MSPNDIFPVHRRVPSWTLIREGLSGSRRYITQRPITGHLAKSEGLWSIQPWMSYLYHTLLFEALRSMWKKRQKYCMSQRWWATQKRVFPRNNRADAFVNSQRFWQRAPDLHKSMSDNIPAQSAEVDTSNQDTVSHWYHLGEEAHVFFHGLTLCLLTILRACSMFSRSWPTQTDCMLFLMCVCA